MKRYLLQFLIAIDQLINTLFGGWADETLSSRAYRLQSVKKSWAWTRKVIDTLFFWQANHCEKSYMNEEERRHLPPELRK